MEDNQDETDAPTTVKDDDQGLLVAALDEEKESPFWMSGVMGCFSSVVAAFTRSDIKPTRESDWDVPYSSMSDLMYLGCGAQGVVYSGYFRGELVAVKKLRDRSETSIKHLRKLNHENIVRFRGVCTAGPYCVIMEFCQYGPLFEFLHSGAFYSPRQIIKWAKDIARGMAYLHSHKIIHRDLKSPNILIGDNLVVKVSDFGTSRVWDDVSAIMSFSGTVAWMAPEVIRHEPCSERVDVWSYGVVLWELLTQEVPYRPIESHAILWGVGTDTISIPLPTSWPATLQQLLGQCWSRVPRNRPPFKIIAANVEVLCGELISLRKDCFNARQAAWRNEVQEYMEKHYVRSEQPSAEESSVQRREEIRNARNLRQMYEQQVLRANDLYMEACAVKLQLEERERVVAEREKALQACRCNYRKATKYFHRQTSSSSDSVRANMLAVERRRKKKEPAYAHVVVNYIDKPQAKAKTVTVTVDDTHELACACADSVQNNNVATVVEKKDTVVEQNGNVDVKGKMFAKNNNKDNVAHV